MDGLMNSEKEGATNKMSRNGYINLVESISDIVFQINVNAGWTFLNNSWTRIMGYNMEETMGIHFSNYLHPDDRLKSITSFEYQINGLSDHFNQEIRFVTKTGETVWMKVVSTLIRNTSKEVICVSGTMQDVGRDREIRDMSELLAHNIQDMVCMLELNGSYKYVSPSIKDIAGYLPEELIGKHPVDFAHPDDVPKLKSRVIKKKILKDSNINSRFRTKNGEYKWIETNTKTIFDEGDIPIGFVSSSQVIDIRKKAEDVILKSLQKERELNKMKSNFVSVASHEFRTPLAIIRSSLELSEIYASKVFHLVPNMAKHNKNIFKQIDRLTLLIDEVLIVSKLESEGFTCKREEVDLVELLNEIIFYLNNIQKDNRKVVFNIKGTPRKVMIDSLLINHAVTNIITNAFKYSAGKPGPIITLCFYLKTFSIKVKDFGIGIPPDDQSKIFQAFYRAENATMVEGTGLGMFIAKRFIELHKGKISFASVPGVGTEFGIKMA